MDHARFFCPNLAAGVNPLPPEEARHAATVRRVRLGEAVVLFNGAGAEAVGRVSRADRRRVEVDVARVDRRPFELSRRVTLAVAMPRVHRQGYLVEKCTELGAAAIQPILTERGVTRGGAEAVEKWHRRAIEAAKQSGRAHVPTVELPQPFERILDAVREYHAAAIAHPHEPRRDLHSFFRELPPDGRALVFIGPEGGWSEGELAAARDRPVEWIALSPTTLRTETAAAVVCAVAAEMDALPTASGR
jgi:16S rRNA (uracil1498-N3)-methyltransferase